MSFYLSFLFIYSMRLIVTLMLFLIFDLLWFSYALPNIYQSQFDLINNTKTNYRVFPAGIYAWLCMAIAMNYLVIDSTNINNLNDIIIKSIILGFAIYGTYNGTNYATIHNWNLKTFIYDNLWGVIVCVLTGYTLHHMIKNNYID
jgi:uncharacterized membrane protein